MYQTIEINTMEELLAMVSDQPYDENNGRNRGYYLYRGLPDAAYELKTSLQRNCAEKSQLLEPKILANFSKYTAMESSFETDTVWKRMLLGQHHGLPTRLLDWTHSPFIALHFATDVNMAILDQMDCAIWRIDIQELHDLLPEEFTHVMHEEGTVVFSIDMLSKAAETIEAYDQLTNGTSMVIMEPPSVDPRIVNQYAFFSVVPGQMNSIEAFLNRYTKKTVKYVINKNLKWRIRDFLDEANISERTVYPGLDGICKWLARHYYVKPRRAMLMKETESRSFCAAPTVATMDMGLEYDYITPEGVGTGFGGMGDWPAYRLRKIEDIQWAVIFQKFQDRTLCEEDFDGTDIGLLIKNLHDVYGDSYEKYYGDTANVFSDLSILPAQLPEYFYCLFDIRSWGEKPNFYANEAACLKAFEYRYCDDITPWNNLDDDELEQWLSRSDLMEFPFVSFKEQE